MVTEESILPRLIIEKKIFNNVLKTKCLIWDAFPPESSLLLINCHIKFYLDPSFYQTAHFFLGFILEPTGHSNAVAKSLEF